MQERIKKKFDEVAENPTRYKHLHYDLAGSCRLWIGKLRIVFSYSIEMSEFHKSLTCGLDNRGILIMLKNHTRCGKFMPPVFDRWFLTSRNFTLRLQKCSLCNLPVLTRRK